MTFAFIAIDGLDRMHITTSPAERESYLAAWREVGRIMGVADALLPANFDHAEQITRAIQADQVLSGVPPTDPAWADGRLMTGPLLGVLDAKMLPGVPATMMRLFLPRDVADGLGVPRRLIADALIHNIVRGFGWLDTNLLERFSRKSRVLRHVSLDLMQMMLEWERGGDRQPFRIPDSLDWYDETGSKRTFGQRVLTRSAALTTRA
jgi:hypothetical protein